MKINPSILTLDIKVQDKFRELLSDLANGNVKLKDVMLGDSDIDYEISQNINNARIHNAPFNVERIKFPLVYDGTGRGMDGYITCFARKVNSNGTLSSIYEWPTNFNWTVGDKVPPVYNGYDWNALEFDSSKMGYILYFQTLLNSYYDPTTSLIQRLNERIDAKITFAGSETVPPGWEITRDTATRAVTINGVTYNVYHNSILIAKAAGAPLTQNTDGLISVSGAMSNITKIITFNI